MFEVVSNEIRDFQYNFKNWDHLQFWRLAFNIGLIPNYLERRFSQMENSKSTGFDMASFLEGESIRVVSLIASNYSHQEFVFYGLKIGLFPSTFLNYLANGLNDGEENFSSEDINSVRLLMQGVEQALCEAFSLPSTQTEAPRKKNFSQMMGRETVEVIVGEGEDVKEFVVHKDLLMEKVSFFKKMFNSGFLESSAGKATLPEDNPEAFEVLIEWVYCSNVNSLHEAERPKSDQVDLAISTIALAEKYLLPELGNHAVSFLAKIGKDLVPTMSQMSTLYDKTPSTAKARIYAARTIAWALVSPETNGVSNNSIYTACQNGDLLLDAIKEVRGTHGQGHKRAHEHPVCDYHNHTASVECPYQQIVPISNWFDADYDSINHSPDIKLNKLNRRNNRGRRN